MSKGTPIKIDPRTNPFQTAMADSLWEKLDKDAKPISKEELLKKIQNLRDKEK